MDFGCRLTAALALMVAIAGNPALANPASRELRAKATRQIYNLDRDEAAASYREAIAADPQDAAAYRGLASALWLSITFRRGNMCVYLTMSPRPASTLFEGSRCSL